MATLDEIDAKIAVLETALAQGVQEVAYQDRRVRYQSSGEMLAALKFFRDQRAAVLTQSSGGGYTIARVRMD